MLWEIIFDIMKDVTLTPAMGNYLDMVNNDKPAVGQHANENYAREIMQLFRLGLNQLNPDGTPVLDATGNPVPTYTQDDVMALGLAFTGWTYPMQPGSAPQKHNPSILRRADGGRGFQSRHGQQKLCWARRFQRARLRPMDLDSALTIIFNHPNVGPFVARQLILRLVTSNPSPAYIQRVATAFNTGTFNGYGVLGTVAATCRPSSRLSCWTPKRARAIPQHRCRDRWQIARDRS